MATYSASSAKTITLVANTVDTITLTGTGNTLHVFQTSTSTPIYFTAGQPGTTPATPTVAGDDNYAVMNGYNSIDFPWTGTGAVIKVISAGTPTVQFLLQ